MLSSANPAETSMAINEGTPLIVTEVPSRESDAYGWDNASLFSRITFWFMSRIIKLGHSRPLEMSDLGILIREMRCGHTYQKIEHDANRLQETKQMTVRLFYGLMWKLTGSWMTFAGFCLFLGQALNLIGPLIIGEMIAFVERRNGEEDDDTELDWLPYRNESYYGYILATAMLFNYLLQTFVCHQHHFYAVLAGLSVRGTIMDMIYRKTLRLSSTSRQEFTVGQLVNMINTDSYKVLEVFFFGHYIWISPLIILGCLYFLYGILGNATFIGFGIMILVIPVIGKLTTQISSVTERTLRVTDERVKVINEVIQGIRIIKYYAWESSFLESISEKRSKELNLLKEGGYYKTVNNFVVSSVPIFVALSSFLYFTLVDDKELTPGIAFTSLALFNAMRFPLYVFPTVVVDWIEGYVSGKRISEFLISDELVLQPSRTADSTEPDSSYHVGKESANRDSFASDASPATERKESVAIEIKEGTFSWNLGGEPTLRGINVKIRKGDFVMIVGPVGSGKSSLIAAFIQEISQTQGTTQRIGSIAYAPQQAWIKNDTVQSNILFGKPFDSARYRKVVQACALNPDFEVLPAGDQTEIGEKGINLSGGQKQRVSLARCVYFNSDIVIMDDSLSAVDSHVGKHIFDNCFLSFLKKKTRIFATNQAHFLPYASMIYVMDKGRITASGTYKEIIASGFNLSTFVELEKSEEPVKEASHSPESTPQHETKSIKGEPKPKGDEKPTGKLIEEEERFTGVVKNETYKYYVTACSKFLLWATLIFYSMKQGCDIATDWWLSKWSQDSLSLETIEYIWVYSGLSLLSMIFSFVRTLAMIFGCLSASKTLHNSMLGRILMTPITFFDVTPVGRIINRFSGDITQIDETIPVNIQQFLTQAFILIGVISVQTVVSPFFLALLLPIVIAYHKIQGYFRPTSRELKRLKNISRSPALAHFSETLTGVTTIRAFNMQDDFVVSFESKNDASTNTNVFENTVNRWLGVRLEIIGAVLVSFAAYLIAFQSDSIDPGIAGWGLTYSLLVTNTLNWLVRSITECEAQMSSVERVGYYSNLDTEADYVLSEDPKPSEWPKQGTIKFENVFIRYRAHLPYVLRGINCEITGGERIGVCGRTGAGKSSLMTSLFRIVECTSGRILIDGLDISRLGLHTLRSNLAIIPQDAVLFTGTVRYNLDPFNRSTDEELWQALEKAQLKDVIVRLPEKLSTVVVEGGENFSVGQRQLMCMARALLRHAKVVVLDEATASIDYDTDSAIQDMIRRSFSKCTILTIAHRLNTIMDSDRILVLDNGQVAEFDTPARLLASKSGIFSGLAREAGLAS